MVALLALLVGAGLVAILKSNVGPSGSVSQTSSTPEVIKQSNTANATPVSRDKTLNDSPASVSLPTGTWVGRSQTIDQGETRRFPMSINFDDKIAHDGECQNVGRILSINHDVISLEWPQCGRETVRYSIANNTLTAQGETVDIMGNKNRPLGIKRSWTLSRQ